jgi:uncharacterized membrane protein (UPF0127 family)
MKIFSFLALAAALLFASCSKDGKSGSSPDTLFDQKAGAVLFAAKVAVNDGEKMRGLMGVTSMPENEGMIFVSDIPHMASFWMKNTLIALDIAFVDPEGKILQISPMYPHNEVPVRSTSSNVLYCLEMNQGWFAKNGVKVGDRLDMNLLAKSVEMRRKHLK